MSGGPRFPFDVAYPIAEEAARILTPTLDMVKVVGSLRRKRPFVGDVEFLGVPVFECDLFGSNPTPVLEPVRRALRGMGEWSKGGDRFMQITDLLGTPGLTLDLYLVHPPAEWGSLLAIRTGPWQLGLLAMMALNKNGYRHRHGRILEDGVLVPTPTEEDFFELAGIECLPPARRDAQAEELKAKEQQS